ncbi:MAG: cupin domain-containing protein [Candidatus Methylomirabilales bacterium]
MQVIQAEGIESRRGEKFTGTVWADTLLKAQQPDGVRAYRVFFEPGSRTHWHAHGGEQILYVVAGKGRVKKAGEQAMEIGPGDIVYVAPGEKHWHGAAPRSFMVHIAVTTGGETAWMEEVTEEDYSQAFA